MKRKMVKASRFENWGKTAVFTNVGDSAEGILREIRDFKNENGETKILCLEDDGGIKTAVFLSASLKFYPWVDYLGRYIQVEFIELKKNDKTKRFFKNFEVNISEEIEEINEDLPF